MNLYIKGWHWPHLLFFVLTPLAAIAGTWWVVHNGGSHPATWALAVFMLFACGFGITGGYHRLFSHRSYSAKWPARFLYLLFGGAAFEGSALWWSAEHRIHHKYVDTEKDPYGINKGFWYAHIGWLLKDGHTVENFDNVKDLSRDRLVYLQHRIYPLVAVLAGWGLPTAIAALWGDPWGGFFIAGITRMVFNHHATFCINSVCHSIGKQTYSDKHSAKDSWVAALITYGEGYHNFHHEFQYDYRNGIRAYQWDPTKWLIAFLGWLGLTANLRTARQEKILLAKLKMDQKQIARHLPHLPEAVRLKAHELIVNTETRLRQACTRFQTLKQEYQLLKKEQMEAFVARKSELRLELAQARQEWKLALVQWRQLMQNPLVFSR